MCSVMNRGAGVCLCVFVVVQHGTAVQCENYVKIYFGVFVSQIFVGDVS